MNTTLDLHTHILPSVDDGAKSAEEALDMLSIARANGTDGLVLTPHHLTIDSRSMHFDKEELYYRFLFFKDVVAQNIPDIKLYFGAENFAVDNMRRVIDSDLLITINDTQYILLEFGFVDSFYRALDITSDLSDRGFIPIIAHPERYDFVLENPDGIQDLLSAGGLLQINATSLSEHSYESTRKLASNFLSDGLVSAVASDSHDIYYRAPDLSKAYETVSSECSKEYANLLFYDNPKAIINGTDIR